MGNDFIEKLLDQRCLKFGEVAVGMGFVTTIQLEEALTEQVYNFKQHRLIGQIMLDKGWMTGKQIEKVLTKVTRAEKRGREML